MKKESGKRGKRNAVSAQALADTHWGGHLTCLLASPAHCASRAHFVLIKEIEWQWLSLSWTLLVCCAVCIGTHWTSMDREAAMILSWTLDPNSCCVCARKMNTSENHCKIVIETAEMHQVGGEVAFRYISTVTRCLHNCDLVSVWLLEKIHAQ